MSFISKTVDAVLRLLSLIGTLCVVLMMLHVTADVVMRYAFNRPLPGTLNIVSRYYMVIIVFLSLAVAERQDAHISVEIVYDLLPSGLRRLLAPLSWLLTAAVFAAVAIRTGQVAWTKTLIRASVDEGTSAIPIWQSYWPVAIGSAVFALFCAYRLVLALIGRADPGAVKHDDPLEQMNE
ncbi:TRAP transporter small permease [Acidimangrovimonas sediminis]|uniref:TRAP transporter small permease n=1 Tax=Acidimangrovimonas sediminis TaxID=2056283 RepID=UPI000C808445|nr:TRAP transporter small permease [Acidimangrovimonas sediminis]